MDRRAAAPPTLDTGVFADGLGDRRSMVDPAGQATLELLWLRGELAAVPSFEQALRERTSRLAGFRHQNFGRVLRVDRLNDPEATVAIVSERTPGVRLSDMLALADERRQPLDINAAVYLARQLVPAVCALHEQARDGSHGAIAPERLVVTPGARLVLVEYVLGSALEQLRFSHEAYWTQLRVPLPRSAGLPRFDHLADVLQVGLVTLALVLGRPLKEDEYPAHIGDVVASAWAISARGGYEPLPPRFRAWLTRTLLLDARHAFGSAIEAKTELDRVLGEARESQDRAATAMLAALVAQCQAAVPAAPLSRAASTSRANAVPIAPANAVPTAPANAVPTATTETVATARGETVPPVPPNSGRSRTPGPSSGLAGRGARPVPTARLVSAPGATSVHPALAGSPSSASGTVVAERPVAAKIDRAMQSVAAQLSRAAVLTPNADPVRGLQPARPEEHDPIGPVSATQGLAATRHAVVESVVDAPSSHEGEPDELGLPRGTRGPRWRASRKAVVAGALVVLAGAAILVGQRLTSPSEFGTLSVTTDPPGGDVLVDGRPRGPAPLRMTLKAGAHLMEVRGPGGARSMRVAISPGAEVSQYLELPKSETSGGQLQVRTEPEGARVTVDGVPRGISPVTIPSLSPGAHAVVLDSEVASIKRTVTIEAGAAASLAVPLVPTDGASPGWIAVSAPVSVDVYEHQQRLGTSDGGRIALPAGSHEIELINDVLGYRVARTVRVAPGKGTPIRIDFPKSTIDINALPWAEVWIDGDRAGETPIGNFPVTIGPHELVFRHPDLGEQRRAVTVTLNTPARVSVDLRR